ncbi:MAG TPA: Trm112 family protein [Gammaproteobacteria bacterium]|nr:Trm112 family protein [Gammaproteobacteria bacterium]
MDKKQIELVACPECQGRLTYDKSTKELLCEQCKLAFPVEDGIPVLMAERGRKLESEAQI